MSRILLISDTHFGHKNICKYRPQFKTIQEHDEAVFDGICSNISKNDNLWILGDIAFDHGALKYVERMKDYCQSLNIVLGNHDTENQQRQAVLKSLIQIADNTHTLVTKNDFWISHYPIHPDELRGKMNIHGHVHAKSVPDERYVNVCCENVGYKPISFQEIKNGWRSNT